jgi:hypothetical protein
VAHKPYRPPFKHTYVFATHPGKNKEYVWRLTKKTKNREEINVGKNIIVNSEGMSRTVTVTRIESLSCPPTQRKIKKVYEVL